MQEAGPYSTWIPSSTDAGAYTVWYKITDSENYTGTTPSCVLVSIQPKNVSSPTVNVSPLSFVYDGSEKSPSVVVMDGSTEIPSTEYTLEYADNVNAGTAAVHIRDMEGGNYTVNGEGSFTIVKPSALYIKEIKKDGNQFTVTLEGDLPTGSSLL